jgi:transcriptional regulator with XRE-family HTH domain
MHMSLREIRNKKGITQEQLEGMTGIEQPTISALETGRIKKPSWEIVARLSKALNVNPEELFPVDDTAA